MLCCDSADHLAGPDGTTPHISREVYMFLTAEVERLSREAAVHRAAADYWYLRANYSEAELAEMYEAASKGLDEHGEWLGWPSPDTSNHRQVSPDGRAPISRAVA